MWELVSKPSVARDTLLTMARSQDRALGILQPKTFYLSLDVPINTISTNREFTQVVVAGRHVFKILGISETGFSEVMNLRVGRINLNFSITDVIWHHLDDSTIATAAGNGAVMLWDLNKPSKAKNEFIFTDHRRTVNKICFHPTDASILLSGCQDGTINYFDIRTKGVVGKFLGRSDSIRDVQFHPVEKNTFAAACESGSIQLLDLRKAEHTFTKFTGHSGPVFSLDWHPEDRYLLGTGGRDKSIKVWNIQSKGTLIHCVPTIAEVACVRWRPKEKYHIASCALVVDHHVSVWDVRRPYIPFAAFTEHTDVATGIIWHKESEIVLSCSKDSMIYQHVFQDALRPAEHAPPVGLGFSCKGEICNAYSNQAEYGHQIDQRKAPSSKQMVQQAPAMPTFFKKAVPEQDFKSVHSTVKLYDCKETVTESSFEILAKKLLFSGKPFADICTQNANVCHDVGSHKKAQTWLILKFLFSQVNVDESNPLSNSKAASMSDQNHLSRGESNEGNFNEGSNGSYDGGEEAYTDVNKEDEIDMAVGADFDAIFQDDQFDSQFFAADNIHDDIQDWTLPNEAFQPRHSIGEKSLAVDQTFAHQSSQSNSDRSSDKQKSEVLEEFQFLKLSKYHGLPEWDFKPLVVDMLLHLAEQGDVQMAVTIILVLQDRLTSDEISITLKEEWFQAYLELLSRFQLWGITSKIIKLSNIPTISILNQESTSIQTVCGGCNKPMPSSSGWFCKRCDKSSAACSICHLPVKGLYAWCQGCGHGGHLVHIQQWIQSNRQCPAGCGHRCEYS